jgi:hypothetical protein
MLCPNEDSSGRDSSIAMFAGATSLLIPSYYILYPASGDRGRHDASRDLMLSSKLHKSPKCNHLTLSRSSLLILDSGYYH